MKIKNSMRMMSSVISFAAYLALVQCSPAAAQATGLSCQGRQHPRQLAELLFGRDIGGHVGVSEKAWARFVAREVTPRFPDGLTITDAAGQWRDPTSGKAVREPAKRMEIVLPGGADDESRLEAIADAYKRQFQQQSVGVIVRPVCASF